MFFHLSDTIQTPDNVIKISVLRTRVKSLRKNNTSFPWSAYRLLRHDDVNAGCSHIKQNTNVEDLHFKFSHHISILTCMYYTFIAYNSCIICYTHISCNRTYIIQYTPLSPISYSIPLYRRHNLNHTIEIDLRTSAILLQTHLTKA